MEGMQIRNAMLNKGRWIHRSPQKSAKSVESARIRDSDLNEPSAFFLQLFETLVYNILKYLFDFHFLTKTSEFIESC